MDELDLLGMQSIASYARTRILLKAVFQIIFSLPVMLAAAAFVQTGPSGTGSSLIRPAGDTPAWWYFFVGLALAVLGVFLFIGGISRFLTAFDSNCYLKAGPTGIAARLPVQTWYGVFQVKAFRFDWGEIQQFVHYIKRTNGITVATELRVIPKSGKMLKIPRNCFDADVKQLLERIQSIRTLAGK